MKVIRTFGLVGTLVASFSVNAFDLGDALNTVNTVNEVSKTVNQLQAPEQVAPTPTPTPVPQAQPQINPVVTQPKPVSLEQYSAKAAVPKEFYGEWGVKKNCKTEPEDQGVEINKDGMSGYEWRSEIKSSKWVKPGTKVELMVISCSDGDCESDIKPSATKQFLELGNNGNSLTISDAQGGTEKYVRCGRKKG